MLRYTLILCTGLLLLSSADAKAERTTTADAHVAHDRLAPVIMHRTLPPYTGIHVYSRPSRRAGR